MKVPLLPKWIRWAGVVGIAAIIFYTSILTTPPETPIDTIRFDLIPLDKWRHFVAYGAFAGSLVYATVDRNIPAKYLAIIAIGFSVGYGIGIEVWQSYLPERYFSIMDAYANGLGALIVVPWYYLNQYLEYIPGHRLLEELPPR